MKYQFVKPFDSDNLFFYRTLLKIDTLLLFLWKEMIIRRYINLYQISISQFLLRFGYKLFQKQQSDLSDGLIVVCSLKNILTEP